MIFVNHNNDFYDTVENYFTHLAPVVDDNTFLDPIATDKEMFRKRYIIIWLFLQNVNALEVKWNEGAVVDVNLLSKTFDELMDEVVGQKQLQVSLTCYI